MMRALLWIAAGIGWLTLTFLVGLFVTFPSDTVAQRIEYESVGFFDKEFALSMASVRPWITGARATDVTFYGLKRGKRTKDNPDPGYDRTPIFTASSVVLKPKPIDYMLGKRGVGWSASLLGGSIGGSYATSEAATDLAWEIDDLDLTQLPLTTADRVINLTGTLSGAADLHLDTEDPKSSTGTFTLTADGFGLGEGSKVSGFELPAAPFTKASIVAAVENGKLTVSEGEFEGSVMSASISGDITLNKKMMRSRTRFDLAFTLPEEFDKLAQLSPTLKRSKDEEGRYHCSMSGQVFAPTFRCGKSTVTPRSKGGDSVDRDPVVGGNNIGGGGFDPDMSDDDRRAAREKRIAERRERLKQRRDAAAKARGEEGPPLDPRGPDEEGPDIGLPPNPNENFPPEPFDGAPQGPPDFGGPGEEDMPVDDQNR